MDVMAISLHEPYATAMRRNWKKNETRHWPIKYRGPLLICAAKKIDPDYMDTAELYGIRDKLHFGMAVALVDLIECVTTDLVLFHGQEREWGNYTSGRFAWITDNLRVIEPFPVKGQQGLFKVCNVDIKTE